MTAPIVSLPETFSNLRLIGGDEHQQLWRAEREGRQVALRLVRFGDLRAPMMDPTFMLRRQSEFVAGLELKNVAEPIVANKCGDGYLYAEAWADGDDLSKAAPKTWSALAQALAGVLGDLVTLHEARKWHGGIRPSRIRLAPGRATLIGLPWTATITGWKPATFQTLVDTTYVAPEVLEHGAKGVGTAMDVFALGKTLLAVAPKDTPAAIKDALNSAASATGRPTIGELHKLLAS